MILELSTTNISCDNVRCESIESGFGRLPPLHPLFTRWVADMSMYTSQSNLNVPSGATSGADSSRTGFRTTAATSNLGNWASDQPAFGQSQYEPGYLLSATMVCTVSAYMVVSINASISLQEARHTLRHHSFRIPSVANVPLQCMQSLARSLLRRLLGMHQIFLIRKTNVRVQAIFCAPTRAKHHS